jgi:hypothetical protein
MEIIKLNSICLINKFEKHGFYKKDLLNIFKLEKNFTKNKDEYYSDNIHKLDYYNSSDFNRDWVKLIIKDLQFYFESCLKILNFEKVIINDIWFQQYRLNGTHGWHTHGFNYTGVYYVDFKKNYAKTELINPIDNKKIIINAEEGDIVIFPSFIIHRSALQKLNKTKTIISFNLSFIDISKEYLEKINDIALYY